MIYREYRKAKYSNARLLVVEIAYREYDRKILYMGGLLFERKSSNEIGSLKKLIRNLPTLLPDIVSLEITPLFGYELAEISKEMVSVRRKSKVSHNVNDYIYN